MANQPLLRNWPVTAKAAEFSEIMQNNGHYAIQGQFWYQSKAHM